MPVYRSVVIRRRAGTRHKPSAAPNGTPISVLISSATP